jgi:hypothetical protein
VKSFCGGLMDKEELRKLLPKEKVDNIVFKIMLENENFMKLPDYYVKQVCYKAVIEILSQLYLDESILN